MDNKDDKPTSNEDEQQQQINYGDKWMTTMNNNDNEQWQQW